MMEFPKSISPCPIIDALVELRFSTNINPNAVFGILYSVLKENFNKVDNLPILQLPEAVRAADPNLKYKPHYKFSEDKFVVQVGPRVVSLSSSPDYSGWDAFSKFIIGILENIEKTSVIDKIERVGLRYINFFEDQDIYKNIKVDLSINSAPISFRNTVLRTEIAHDKFNSTLQIANRSEERRVGKEYDA